MNNEMMKQNNHTFIDSTTYDIIPDNKIIEVDDDIAETISVLNKKGYKTKYCCSGHANKYEYYSIVCDKYFLNEEKLKKDFVEYYISDITDKKFKIIYPKTKSSIYIMFIKDYRFNNIPKGFKKIPEWDNKNNKPSETEFNSIEHIINYYKDKKIRNNKNIQKEIDKYNKLLLEWAKALPNIN